LESTKLHNVPTERLILAEVEQKFPQFRYEGKMDDNNSPDDCEMTGEFEPGGGMVRPETIVDAALKEAENDHGAIIWENTEVKAIQAVQGDGSNSQVKVSVERDGQEIKITARTAAGAWTSEIILPWKPHLRPVRILQTWLDVSTPNMPCIVMVKPTLPIPV
jgi:glycine/D-amino acid oxidase-like deaminating enzyme